MLLYLPALSISQPRVLPADCDFSFARLLVRMCPPFPITTILSVIYYHTSFDFTRPFWLMGRISERLYQNILLQAVEFLQDPSGLKQVLQCIFFSNLDQLIIIITA